MYEYLKGKKILIGVSGGIAAYKVCEIIRDLKKSGARCRVVMTTAATKFITPLTLETLSEAPVLCELFPEFSRSDVIHIEAARWPDIILLCPATANLIGKIAHGIADNLLTCICMAAKVPILICPAMNTQMYLNPIVQDNLKKLRQFNYQFIVPGVGNLACHETGVGRLADKEEIIKGIIQVLFATAKLKGIKILITAGRTEENLDPVRFLTNRSSGKMGFALAEVAALHGAEVTLISGPNNLKSPPNVMLIRINAARQMAEQVFRVSSEQQIIIMAAAVADFQPKTVSLTKIKKQANNLQIELERTIDILATLGRQKKNQILVGFALETDNQQKNAIQKLREKNLDLIVLNDPKVTGAGFDTDTNQVTLIDKNENIKEVSLMSKFKVAEKIFDQIIEMMKSSHQAATST
ncbi:bifunctional phosphopantothenoylcysteine decarboxylase/phosphopantothenate--cysteine ligase CoaBC [candidate division KSB1 bacterium]|nr:bifunctional phosphopantothenoylcysteine decarboxylase/phosphopantothenate--cysteine ligase CoaBC [candidate division KSB1 bacterium]